MQNNIYDELNRLQSWSRSDQWKLLEGLLERLYPRDSMELPDQWKLLEGLLEKLRQGENVMPQPLHKAREFRGVGRETWKDVDVEEYLRQERASWDD